MKFIAVIFIFLNASSLRAQLTANFSANKTSGCAPLTNIFFQDISTPAGTITSWQWIFENNGISTLQNPVISYLLPGTYDVTLIVSNGTTVDTIVKPNFITVFAKPVANFSSDVTGGCIPLTVNFSDTSVAADTLITQWSWDFGDGATSTQQNPSHTYNTAGTYTVVLHVTDANGCEGFKTISNYITTTPKPTANFTTSGATIACAPPLTVNFVNNSTGTGNLTYLWYFGDTTTSTSASPSHTYGNFGLYNVALVVTDPNGCKDSLMIINMVQITDVIAAFTMSADTVCPGQQVVFNSTSIGAVTYNWTFGDTVGTSTAQTPPYTYGSAGNFVITLIATGAAGACSDTISDTINVELVTANFTSTPNYNCDTPLTVNFTETATNDISWSWTFGDGGTSTSQNPAHTYTAQGAYTVTLTVTSPHGCTASITKTNNENIFIVQPDFIADTVKGCKPLTVHFTSTSSPPDSVAIYNWNFGDGTPNSSLQNPTHIFLNDGDFNVTLIVTDVSGCLHDTVKLDFIKVGFPQNINFSVDMDTACADTVFTFTDLSFDPALIDEWTWTIGGYDTTGMQLPPPPGTVFGSSGTAIYTPTDTGFMYVQLKIGYNGCYDSLLLDSFIYVLGPYITISNAFNCDTPFTYNFSLNDSLGVQRWYWNFGDGSPLDSVNEIFTSHTYASTGDYTISDSTFNDTTGCKMVKTLNIMVRDIKADFTMDTTLGCLPLTINFDGSPSQDETNSYQWNFGDSTVYFNGTLDTTNSIPIITHIFNIRGVKDVKLIVADVNGCKDTIIKTIHVFKPYSLFTADTLTNCVPMLVNFSDTSVSDTTVVAWHWDFGDGGTDSVQNPSHGYSSPGGETVTLIVTDTLGCRDTLVKSNYIIPIQPYPNWSVDDATECFGTPANFTNGTTYPNSNISNVNYQWSFSTGQSSVQVNPSVIFTDTGFISVTLIATDTVLGCDSSVTMNNFVQVQAMPVADFYSDTNFASCYPALISFTDTSVSDYLTNWQWSFGDGSSSVLQDASHSYTYPDTFDVQLIVTTTFGCVDDTIKPADIIVIGPVASFAVIPDTVCIGDMVTFVLTYSNNVSNFSWDFGDGSGAMGANDTITYVYHQTGTLYPKIIYSSGNNNCVKFDEDTIFIHQVFAGFAVDTTPCRSIPTVFTDTSLNANTFHWDFGDGDTSIAQNPPAHTYTQVGQYPATLIISNNLTGCKDTARHTIHVYFSCDSIACALNPPVVNTIADTAIVVGEEVTLFSTILQSYSGIAWTPPDSLTCNNCLDPVARPHISTTYTITVKDSNNCFSVSDNVFIEVINEYSVDVPTAFTPNGDGINDTIFVRGWGIKNLLVYQIYDRWGQLVFETTNIKAGWDGTYKGQPQNAETYVYVVNVETYGGGNLSKKGYITLIR